MKNWISLKGKDYDKVWDRFYEEFQFRPSIYKKDWPSFRELKPFITYDISSVFRREEVADDFDDKLFESLKFCVEKKEYIYGLDWQHESFLYNPHLSIPKGIWATPFFPDGDYYFHLNRNFEWGILSHPWEQSMCIFGDCLVACVKKNPPSVFKKILRQSY